MEKEDICLAHEKVCQEWDENVPAGSPLRCKKFEDQCQSMVSVCKRWDTICKSKKISTCANYIFVDDEEQCIEYFYGCDLKLVKDKTCEAECQRREESYNFYYKLYASLLSSLQSFEKEITTFEAMVNTATKKTDFLKILDISFEKLINAPVRREDISV